MQDHFSGCLQILLAMPSTSSPMVAWPGRMASHSFSMTFYWLCTTTMLAEGQGGLCWALLALSAWEFCFASRPAHALQQLECCVIPDSPAETVPDLQGEQTGHVEGWTLPSHHRPVFQHAKFGVAVSQVWSSSHSRQCPWLWTGSPLWYEAYRGWHHYHSDAWLWCQGTSLSFLGWVQCQQSSVGHAHHVRSEPECSLGPEASWESGKSFPITAAVCSNSWHMRQLCSGYRACCMVA